MKSAMLRLQKSLLLVVCAVTVFAAGVPQAHAGLSVEEGDSIYDIIIGTWDFAGSFGDGTIVLVDVVGGTEYFAIFDANGSLTITTEDPFAQYTP